MPLSRVLLDQQPPSCLETVCCSDRKALSGGLDASLLPGAASAGNPAEPPCSLSWRALGAGGTRNEMEAAPKCTGDERARKGSGTMGLVGGLGDPTAVFQNVPGQRVRASFQTSVHRKCTRPCKIYLAKSGHQIQSLRSERGFCLTGKSQCGLNGEVIYRHLCNTL